MFWAREYAEESAEDQLKPGLRILRRNFGDRRLVSDNEVQIGNQIHNKLPIRI